MGCRGFIAAQQRPAMAHQVLKPVGCKTERGHIGAVGVLAVRIPGKLRFQHIVDTLFSICFQFRLALGALDLVAELVERLDRCFASRPQNRQSAMPQ